MENAKTATLGKALFDQLASRLLQSVGRNRPNDTFASRARGITSARNTEINKHTLYLGKFS